ncbi:MAG: glycosyltransferase family 2 protein [Bacteroidaceae bacterium]|nr:glycosyltransferase family 2 protein [Bacteroidaceae bacterium]
MTAEHPLVSVLMAVYNAEAWLDQALDSVLDHQTMREVEVLAVDDASTDGSWPILQRRREADPRLRIFRQEMNQGQAVARNRALKEARGEYVMMLDADDWLSGDALREAVEVFRKYPQTDSVFFRLILHWQEDGREEDYSPSHVTGQKFDVRVQYPAVLTGIEALRLSVEWKLHGYYLVRRELHQHYPYDDSLPLYSDDNTTHLHYLHSREVRPCAGIYYWRQHARSSTTALSPRRFLLMESNLVLRNRLRQEGVPRDILERYERHRWHNYLGQLWLYFDSRGQLDKETRTRLCETFRRIYHTFPRRLPFGLFRAGQWLRWVRRRLMAKW